MPARVGVLLAAGGAAWEAEALRAVDAAGSGLTLLRRCVDLTDLLATAATGQARAAVLSAALAGLDADGVAALHRNHVQVVVVHAPGDSPTEGQLRRLGVDRVLGSADLDVLVRTVLHGAPVRDAAAAGPGTAAPAAHSTGYSTGADDPADDTNEAAPWGRRVVVWGPAGAPGRTTVAVTLAAELARRGSATVLLDADGYGGTVAQHLGVLDEVSGLLAAARVANAGELDAERLATLARQVGDSLRVLTGLPRADRWYEVREAALATILDLAGGLGRTVVVDTGFCLEQDPDADLAPTAPQRNQLTLTALEQADETLVVGSADPVGLARLVRGLVELHELLPGRRERVVVNRMRRSLGWTEKEVAAMLEGVVPVEDLVFLPEDREACDRALVTGTSLVECGDSALRRAVARLVDDGVGGAAAGSPSVGGPGASWPGSAWRRLVRGSRRGHR